MLECINTSSMEYQQLKSKAGIPEFSLEATSRRFMTEYGRLPHLDELPDSDSEPYLKNSIKIKSNDSVKISKVLEYTGKDNVHDAVVEINNQHRDLEVKMIPVLDEAIVKIQHRPTDSYKKIDSVTQDEYVDSYQVLMGAMDKLYDLYGININPITNAELESDQWNDKINDVGSVNAFIYEGNIYINVDKASVDAPIHEMLHLFVGSLRFTNPKIYQELLQVVEKLPNYDMLAQKHLGRTRNDLNEEILVTEMGRYLSGLDSEFSNLSDKLRYELGYNVNRMLDTVLMGQNSVKSLDRSDLFNLSLKDIAGLVHSSVMVNEFKGTFNAENSDFHRRLNNQKADLLRNGTLEEICD